MKIGRRAIVHRSARRFAAGALVAAMLFASASSVVDTVPARAALAAGTVGVTAITIRDDSSRLRQYDAIKSEGFPAVRLIVEWPLIEPQPGQYDWTSIDAQVDDARQHGLTILAVVTYAPAWAVTPEGRNFVHPAPANPATFVEFTRIAADRYRGVIRNWEIWNEPNIRQNFAPDPDVALYSAMLVGAYAAIKTIDPYSVVISGGTSPAVDGPGSIAPTTFINGLLTGIAANSFDGVGMHPYSSPNLLSAQREPYSSKVAIGYVTRRMNQTGQGHKRLWFTEYGASTANTPQGDDADTSAQHVGVSEDRQAEILVDGINYLRSLPNGGPIFIFDHRDLETFSTTVDYSYGLLRADFTPKPALAAVQRLLTPR